MNTFLHIFFILKAFLTKQIEKFDVLHFFLIAEDSYYANHLKRSIIDELDI